MRIAYFGHDTYDAAIARRVRSLSAAGHEVTGLMMRRGEVNDLPWDNIDLGRTWDAAYVQRLRSIWKGAEIAASHGQILRDADVIIARNLDMMICASLATRRAGAKAPLIYECLDVHHMLTAPGPAAAMLRRMERSLLRQSHLLVISSPAFERDYFARYHGGAYTPFLLENRIASGSLPPRPQNLPGGGERLTMGWFGMLRCRRSLAMMVKIARDMPQVKIHIAGKPVIDGFDKALEGIGNIRFTGAYRGPDDLPDLYGSVDLVWAGDFYQADFNSKALLPNRVYEGGYFGVPAIAPEGTETSRWLSRHGTGFAIADPVEISVPALLQQLDNDRAVLAEAKRKVLALPEEVFVEPVDMMDRMLDAAVSACEVKAAS